MDGDIGIGKTEGKSLVQSRIELNPDRAGRDYLPLEVFLSDIYQTGSRLSTAAKGYTPYVQHNIISRTMTETLVGIVVLSLLLRVARSEVWSSSVTSFVL